MNSPGYGSSSDEARSADARSGQACMSAPQASAGDLPRWVPDRESDTGTADAAAAQANEIPQATQAQQPSTEAASETTAPTMEPDSSLWRNEISARLDRYRARRKPRPPRYPSLRLRFEEPLGANADTSAIPVFETRSNHALALDGLTEVVADPVDLEADRDPRGFPRETASAGAHEDRATHSAAPIQSRSSQAEPSHTGTPHTGAKILEFPRVAGAAPPTYHDQLAEPVMDRPRILDVPEVAPLSPALGGITIETLQREEAEKRPGVDFPLENTPLARRIAAAAVDGAIIAAASAIFGFIFWKVTGFRPPLVQTLALTAGILCVLWAAYQYLLLVYSASTPGLRLARLELAHFDGRRTSRRIRRWRVLASYLSAVSLGMGYAWVLLDEDALCWHDRITHTYLAPKKHGNASDVPHTA